MQTRTSRFVSAMVETEGQGSEQASSGLKSAPSQWSLRKHTHPFDSLPMAIAKGPSASIPRTAHRGYPSVQSATLILTAIRRGNTAATIEVNAGLDLLHDFSEEDRYDLIAPVNGRVGFVRTGTDGTAVARCLWRMTGTAPAVEAFRVRPVLGKHDEVLLHLSHQMPTGWGNSPAVAPEVVESDLSGWTRETALTDQLVLGVPWLQEDRELILAFDLAKLGTALAELKALVAPAPASDD